MAASDEGSGSESEGAGSGGSEAGSGGSEAGSSEEEEVEPLMNGEWEDRCDVPVVQDRATSAPLERLCPAMPLCAVANKAGVVSVFVREP